MTSPDTTQVFTLYDALKYVLMPLLVMIFGTSWVVRENKKTVLAKEAREDAKKIEAAKREAWDGLRQDVASMKNTMELTAQSNTANFEAQRTTNKLFLESLNELKGEVRTIHEEFRADIKVVHGRIDQIENRKGLLH